MSNEKLYNMILNKITAPGAEKVGFAWTLKDLCITILSSMFTYEDLPESIPAEFIERFLILNGSIAGWRYDGTDDKKRKDKLIVSIGGEADEPDVYGVGQRYIAATQNGYVKTIDKDVDGVVIYNNSSYEPDIHIINIFVDMLCEMFTSLKTNILYTRNKPVFKAATDKERAAIQDAFNKIKNDLEPIVVTSTNVLEEIEGNESIKVLDITDVQNADKLQYIIKAIDDAFRWFFTLYGQAMQGNGKLAQQTVKEIDGSTSLSFMYPNDRLKMRREGFDRFNKLFGTDVKVRFSDAWLTESIKYKNEADIDADEILDEPASVEDPEENAAGEQPEEQPEDQPEERGEE